MRYKNRFSFLLLFLASLLFNTSVAHACSCAARSTVLEAYENAGVVVIARAVSVERSEGTKESGYFGIKSTRMIVEKIFKGNLKVGDEMIFGQGGGANCIWTFDEQSIDRQFLFYLDPPEKNRTVWYAVTCGRSRGLQYATDDLLYLNKLDKVRDKTRLSGSVRFEKESDLSIEGRTIRIIGANKTYTVKTDKNGVYEIYDLPAGQYLVEPEIPAGWKLDVSRLTYSPSYAGGAENRSLRRIPVVLQNKKHSGLDIHFEIDNSIRGRIYDTTGKVMEHVCVRAVRTQGEKDGDFGCTNEDGNFEIKELTSGSYILVINDDGKISSSEPFQTFYYPNVYEREKAAVMTIGAGDVIEGLNIYVPKMEETITLEGLFLYSDGKPVVNVLVFFKADKSPDDFEGDATTKTDASGRFTLKILKGLKGKLCGEMYGYVGEFEKCPKLEAIIKKTGQDHADIRTDVHEIQAETDLDNLELRYPFPGCKKAPGFDN
jgi:hypothetical protein